MADNRGHELEVYRELEQGTKKSVYIYGYKASLDRPSWAAAVYFVSHYLLGPGIHCTEIIGALKELCRDGKDIFVVLTMPPWRKLLLGSFGITQGSLEETIGSLGASVACELRISPEENRRDVLKYMEAVVRQEERKGKDCFVVSLQALLLWDSAGVSFVERPSTTYWSFWDKKFSPRKLGSGLVNMLVQVEEITKIAVEQWNTTDSDTLVQEFLTVHKTTDAGYVAEDRPKKRSRNADDVVVRRQKRRAVAEEKSYSILANGQAQAGVENEPDHDEGAVVGSRMAVGLATEAREAVWSRGCDGFLPEDPLFWDEVKKLTFVANESSLSFDLV